METLLSTLNIFDALRQPQPQELHELQPQQFTLLLLPQELQPQFVLREFTQELQQLQELQPQVLRKPPNRKLKKLLQPQLQLLLQVLQLLLQLHISTSILLS